MAGAEGRPSDFLFRPLRKPEEYRHAEELQREALGPEAALSVPAALLRSLQDQGGLALGAFADIYVAGLTAASLGWDGTTLYQQVHLTAVRPEYQSHRLGARLMAYLRDEVLRLGLGEARWSYDPLHRPSASLSVRRLGGRPDAYRPNYYGDLVGAGADRPHEESDRLHVRWTLGDPAVERRLAGELPSAADDLARHRRSSALVETEAAESGLRVPTAVAEPCGASAHLEIPFDLVSVRTHEAASVRRWRHAVRDAFRAAFDLGYVVDDFTVVPIEHERRAFYLLRPGRPGPTAPGPSGT